MSLEKNESFLYQALFFRILPLKIIFVIYLLGYKVMFCFIALVSTKAFLNIFQYPIELHLIEKC